MIDHTGALDALFETILDLDTVEECYDFFDDLCTVKELDDMSQRLKTAKLLKAGKSYREIADETGVSTATIVRVAKCLNHGSGGYRRALEKCGDGSDAARETTQ